jgi:hypothetical protein
MSKEGSWTWWHIRMVVMYRICCLIGHRWVDAEVSSSLWGVPGDPPITHHVVPNAHCARCPAVNRDAYPRRGKA